MTRSQRFILRSLGFVALLPLVLASECDLFPTPRAIWSADGGHLLLADKSGVTLCDATGRSVAQMTVEKDSELRFATWYPRDGRRFVTILGRSAKTWNEVRPALSEQEENQLIKLAPTLRAEILAHKGSFDGWKPTLAKSLTDEELMCLWAYLREQPNADLKTKLGDKWSTFADLPVSLSVGQIMHLQGDRIEPDGTAFVSVYMPVPGSVQISPDERFVAWVGFNAASIRLPGTTPPASSKPDASDGKQEAKDTPSVLDLRVAEMKGNGRPLSVDRTASFYPTWYDEGRSLVYGSAGGFPLQNKAQLGTIRRYPVRASEAGKPDHLQLGTPVDLAGILFTPGMYAVSLPDGRILFNSASVQLPSGPNDAVTAISLFSIEPDRSATVAPMVTANALRQMGAEAFGGFVGISPDGTRTIVTSSAGEVTVYEFATGVVQVILPGKNGGKLPLIPMWRNAEELSLVVPAGHEWGSARRAELVLYSVKTKTARCISQSWPDNLLPALAAKDSVTTQPAATQPEPIPASSPTR